MLCHENMLSYYMSVNEMMFRKRGVFEQNITLSELEEMLPFEREIYGIHIYNSIEQHNAEQQKNNKGG